MKRSLKIFTLTACCGISIGALEAPQNGSMAIVEGAPAPNSYDGQIPAALEQWCEEICLPLVTLEMTDGKKNRPRGELHTWGKNLGGDTTYI